MALLKKKKGRGSAEIPLSSMSDISFLLLIFFLVTTTIDVDTGIGMTLPPPLEADQQPPPVRERNMLKILVNAQGQVLLEDKPSAINLVRGEVVKHVLNNGVDPDYSESPSQAVVSLKTDRQTPYDVYVQVLDEIWMGYFQMWDQEAKQMGFPSYEVYRNSLGEDEENVIREKIKAQISIAEPDQGTGG